VPQLPSLLAPAGIAILEIGHTQADAVAGIILQAGLVPTLRRDLAGAVQHAAVGHHAAGIRLHVLQTRLRGVAAGEAAWGSAACAVGAQRGLVR
jgi:hypothetical protein